MVKRLIIMLACMAAVLGFSVAPANAVTLWQETHCQNHIIGSKVELPVVTLCVQTNYGLQSDGDGIRINAVIFEITRGCKWLEHDSSGFANELRTSTFAGFIPVDSQAFSPLRTCGSPVTYTAGIRGADTGRAEVNTHAHVRIDLAQDWSPDFNYNLCRNNAC